MAGIMDTLFGWMRRRKRDATPDAHPIEKPTSGQTETSDIRQGFDKALDALAEKTGPVQGALEEMRKRREEFQKSSKDFIDQRLKDAEEAGHRHKERVSQRLESIKRVNKRSEKADPDD